MIYTYSSIDMRSEDSQSIVDRLKLMRRCVSGSEYNNDYYCGIATDPDDRFADHEIEHWKIKRIVGVVDCGSKEKCCEVEELVNDEGFDVGEAPRRGAGEDTRYVYLVEKGEPIKENRNSKSIFNELFKELRMNDSKKK